VNKDLTIALSGVLTVAVLSIHDWIALIFGIVLMLFTMTLIIIFFTNVWIRGGYAGLNDKLEPHEVKLIFTHGVGALSILALEYMMVNSQLDVKPIPIAFAYIFGSLLGGSGFVIVTEFLNKSKSEKSTDNGS
jgi:hypothetical protein